MCWTGGVGMDGEHVFLNHEHSEQTQPPSLPPLHTGHLNPGPRQCHFASWRRMHA